MEYKNHTVLRMWRALGELFLHFAIIHAAIQKGRLFSWIFCQFSLFCWSNFDLELIYFALSLNTSSYNPIASGTYNRWKMEFVLKTKMTKTSIQRSRWRNCVQRGLVVPIFIHSRSLTFEVNVSLKCVYSGLTPLSTVFQSYHDSVWLLQGAQWGLVVPIFIHTIQDFPVLLFAFLLCKWLWCSAVHNRVIQFTCLVYITSLLIWRRDIILFADFRILTICIIYLYILQGMFWVLI